MFPGGLDRVEGRERLAKFVPGDLVVVDVEALEHGLVEQSALLVVAATVELPRILQEGQAGLDESGAGVQVVLGLVEPSGEVLTLLGDLAELLFDLGLGQCAVGGKVDEVGLLGVEPVQLIGQLLAQQPGGSLLVVQRLGDVGTDVGNEARAEPDQRVVVLDRHLDPNDVDVRCWAAAVLLVAAEEVGVLGAARVDGVLDDQPLGDAVLLAPAAEERALEVVVVDPAAFPGGRA